MEYFDKYVSNTLGAGGNQYYFINENEKALKKGRIFYKFFSSGEFNYSFLFSNTIDSTFSDGSLSHKNLVCDEYNIEGIRVSVCNECNCKTMVELNDFYDVTFDGGKKTKKVMPGELFYTDEVKINALKGQFICVEISFSGKMIPYHEETILPVFTFDDEIQDWKPSNKMPLPSMVGCDRKVPVRVGFVGDSITQGIGTPYNSYDQYSALVADMIGDKYSYWNLGLGYARADDLASDGIWMFKAKHIDVVSVCYGVNDINRGFSGEEIIANLEKIVDIFKKNNIKVLVQTIPPFDYSGEKIKIWNKVNEYIMCKLSCKTEEVLDVRNFLSLNENEPYMSKFGGHPNSEGHRIWARELAPLLKKIIEK